MPGPHIALQLPQLMELSDRLSAEIVDVSTDIDETSDAALRQEQEIRAIAEDSAAIARANQDVAKAADTATKTSQRISERVEVSREAVELAVPRIRGMVESVSTICAELDKVKSALAEVAKVTPIVEQLAMKTKLLALNANIEASSAGSAGAGFAVVAKEIKVLASKSATANEAIDAAIMQLSSSVEALIDRGSQASHEADLARAGTSEIGSAMATVSEGLSEIMQSGTEIRRQSAEVVSGSDRIHHSLSGMDEQLRSMSATLSSAKARTGELILQSEQVVVLYADGVEDHPDRPFIKKAIEFAKAVSAAFEDGISSGSINESDLFSHEYREIPGTNPVQMLAPCVPFTNRVLPSIQDPILDTDESIVYAFPVQTTGYLPTHNPQYSMEPRPDEPKWNQGHCRNLRIFDDRVGIAAAQTRQEYLLQTYKRDMGQYFRLMKDVSAPILVNGRHWGGVRLGYSRS